MTKIYSSFVSFMLIILTSGCDIKTEHITFSKVYIENISKDSTLSVRALDYNKEYVFYGSSGHFGKIALKPELKINPSELNFSRGYHHKKFQFKKENGSLMNFRAVAQVNGDMFALSIESPTRLYKLKRKAERAKLVYEETHPKAFYNALNFWNENEGIAIGDPTNDCLSIIITRDAGESWHKIPCDMLPKTRESEAAFAASNTNITIIDKKTWIATGGKSSRVLFSPDKGLSWTFYETPIIQNEPTTGMYSIDFYDEKHG